MKKKGPVLSIAGVRSTGEARPAALCALLPDTPPPPPPPPPSPLPLPPFFPTTPLWPSRTNA